jgi:hypothetical protein
MFGDNPIRLIKRASIDGLEMPVTEQSENRGRTTIRAAVIMARLIAQCLELCCCADP